MLSAKKSRDDLAKQGPAKRIQSDRIRINTPGHELLKDVKRHLSSGRIQRHPVAYDYTIFLGTQVQLVV